jgi:release factor glutamine methyltransferase
MTIAQALAVAILRLRKSPETPPNVRDEAFADAQILLGEILQADRAWLLAHGAEELDPSLNEIFGVLVGERMRGVPVAYLTHKAGFFGREYYVDEHVLVPRPESEHVVEAVLDELRSRLADGARDVRVCDIGTGSGALAVTLAAECEGARVVASDISADALRVARKNAADHGLGERIAFVQGDLGEPLVARGPFDCIVANLPYVPSKAVPQQPDPVGYEPLVALDGGPDGLEPYRRLIAQLPSLAAPRASVWFEAAPATIDPLSALVEAAYPAAHIEVGEDYAGCERYLAITLDPNV